MSASSCLHNTVALVICCNSQPDIFVWCLSAMSACSKQKSSLLSVAGDDEGAVTSPLKGTNKPGDTVCRMPDTHHPLNIIILRKDISDLLAGEPSNDNIVNFVLGLLQLEARNSASKQTWTFFPSTLMYDLLKK